METTSLTFKTFSNVIYSVFGYIWPIVFSIFVTPLIVFHLGVKQYGIYIFINTVISLFNFLDIGLSVAVTRNIALYHGEKNEHALRTLVRSANSLFFITGFIGFVLSSLIALIAFEGLHFLSGAFAAYQQYAILFVIAGAIFFTNVIILTYNSILNAFQRFDISTKYGTFFFSTSMFGTLLIALLSGSLTYIFLFQLLVGAVSVFVIYAQAKKVLPLADFKFGWNMTEIRRCYAFGFAAAANNIAGTSLGSLDRIVIPFFAGPSNLTYYNMPGGVSAKIPAASNSLTNVLFPMTSKLHGEKDHAKIEALYVRSFRLITMVSAGITVVVIAFPYQILLYWLNADFAQRASGVLVVLALTNFILALGGPLSNFLLGLGKVKLVSFMSIGMAILNAALLLILLPMYGILGAAWAYLISVLPIAYMFYFTEQHYLQLTNRGEYYAKKLAGTLVTGAVIWLLDVFVFSHLISNLFTLLTVAGISMLGYILLYRVFGFFEDEDWQAIISFSVAVLRSVRKVVNI